MLAVSLDIITDANGGITDAKGGTPTPTPPADARGFVGVGCETGDAAAAVRCKDKDPQRVNIYNNMVTFFLFMCGYFGRCALQQKTYPFIIL